MQLYKKESLELLRSRIDLIEVLMPHIDLKKSGASYKAHCPFHEEKTPSFILKQGDTHYHCFGCGAHGDAVSFLMNHLKMGFSEAIEYLAERFQVLLEKEEGVVEEKGPDKGKLKEVLEKAARFYHFTLLHTNEGHEALAYLYARGIDLDFIKLFRIGLASCHHDLFYRYMQEEKVSEALLLDAGLLSESTPGRKRLFFSDRITFPILDAVGSVIGFSARKYKEQTFGGKYINSPETALFKKSRQLFALYYSRKRIAKEKRALVVEGQIDALRLIKEGFTFTVAGLGTAFGEGHVRELSQLGIEQVFLALDADDAGEAAAVKIGNLFQKKGIGVRVVALPQGYDPDLYLKEKGPQLFSKQLESSSDFLEFLLSYHAKKYPPHTPAGKNNLVQTLTAMIKAWEEPVLVHASLHKLAELLDLPSHLVVTDHPLPPHVFVKKSSLVVKEQVDGDVILETDLLRWLFLSGESHPKVAERVKQQIVASDLRHPLCRSLFERYFVREEKRDLLSFEAEIEDSDEREFLFALVEKKINLHDPVAGVSRTILALLNRLWMEKGEALLEKLQSGGHSEEEELALLKEFDQLKKNPPRILD